MIVNRKTCHANNYLPLVRVLYFQTHGAVKYCSLHGRPDYSPDANAWLPVSLLSAVYDEAASRSGWSHLLCPHHTCYRCRRRGMPLIVAECCRCRWKQSNPGSCPRHLCRSVSTLSLMWFALLLQWWFGYLIFYDWTCNKKKLTVNATCRLDLMGLNPGVGL